MKGQLVGVEWDFMNPWHVNTGKWLKSYFWIPAPIRFSDAHFRNKFERSPLILLETGFKLKDDGRKYNITKDWIKIYSIYREEVEL